MKRFSPFNQFNINPGYTTRDFKNIEMIRIFISVGIIILSLSSCNDGNNKDSKIRPNILFICVDDLRPQLGCYGYDYMKTPHIDQLASEGTVFTNHFVQVPTCGATRLACSPENGHLKKVISQIMLLFPKFRINLKTLSLKHLFTTLKEIIITP